MDINKIYNNYCNVFVIYNCKINYCNECDSHYIGEKEKQVKDHIKEHQNNIRIGEQNSMIFQHVANYNHNMTTLILQF